MALAKITKEKVLAEIAIMKEVEKNTGSVNLGVTVFSITKNGTDESLNLTKDLNEKKALLYDTLSVEGVEYLIHSEVSE